MQLLLQNNMKECLIALNVFTALIQAVFGTRSNKKLDIAVTKAQNHKTKLIQTHKINKTGLDHSYKFYSFVLVLYKEIFFSKCFAIFSIQNERQVCHFFCFCV